MTAIITEKKTLSQPNDFAADVLDILRRRKVKFHGCLPEYLEYLPGGDLKMWFYGHRNDDVCRGPWRGGITIMKRESLENALLRGDSNVFADVMMACIDDINNRHA
jgi:hypothetical protein